MAINFPSSPTEGQTYTFNSITWIYSVATGAWKVLDETTGTVTTIYTGNGLAGGTITDVGTISVLPNTGIIANATGVYVNSSYIATLSANNASYLGNVPAASYVNTSGSYTITGNHTHSANIIFNTGKVIVANGSFGSTGQFLLSNGSSMYWSNSNTTNINFLQQGTGAVTRTVDSVLKDTISVKDYGAVGDGSTDDTAAIQAAIDAAMALSASRPGAYFKGCRVYFPRGEYRIRSQITISGTNSHGIHLEGDGEGATVIKCDMTSTTSYMFVFGSNTTRTDNCSMSRMSFYSVPKMTAGAVIKIINGHSIHLKNLRFSENPSYPSPLTGNAFNTDFTRFYKCIDLRSSSQSSDYSFSIYLENIDVNNGVEGIIIGENPGSENTDAIVQDVYIYNCSINQCVDNGILLIHAGGIYMDNITMLYNKTGFGVYPSSSQAVYWVFGDKIICDTSVTDGCKILTNGGFAQGFNFTNFWASNNGKWQNGNLSTTAYPNEGRGIWISAGSGTIKGINFNNCVVLTNRQEGLFLENCSYVHINLPMISGNSSQASNTYSGIRINAGISNWSVTGGSIGSVTSGASHKYGIEVNNGSSNYYQIIGVNAVGNIVGGIYDGGTGVNKYLAGNFG